jgi:uncharacterized protein (DUF2249 family)
MSFDAVDSEPALEAAPKATQSGSATPASSNDAVIDAIRAHHTQLADQLRIRTDAVLAAARDGDCTTASKELHDWYRKVLIPHAVAEEHSLYSPASELGSTRLLVCGMLAEHRFLISQIADLAVAAHPFEVAAAAAAAQAVFTVHLSKENDLLLPALDQAGTDLATILDGMHEILGRTQDTDTAADTGDDGCGCGGAHDGCGCGGAHDGPEPDAVVLQIGSPPTPADSEAGPDTEIDVRALPHGQRHEIIFTQLDLLRTGQSLVIVNDHDPKSLRYQTSARWPDRFDWSYLQAGPQVWRVAITPAG